MTVLHVLASTRADHGGTSRSVPAICEALAERDVNVHLVTAAPPGEKKQAPILPDGTVRTHLIEENGLIASRLRSPWAFARQLHEVVVESDPDIIHDHGAWLPSNVLAAWTAWWHDVPLVVSPRGMFTDWALSHQLLKKRLAWYGYQKWAFRQATCFHVTAESEARSLRELGISHPAAVIPNGVSFPDTLPSSSEKGPKRALFLSRIHPKKGLPMLLTAWAKIQPVDWVLEIVGPSDGGHRAELEAQAKELGLSDDVQFSGPVDDTDKWKKYASADLFVLPSHSENFGIVVAEALAAGVPVITTKGTPWRELETKNCGWWIEPNVDALSDALRHALRKSPKARREMGNRGRNLVKEKYSWFGIAGRMQDTYRWIAAGNQNQSEKPHWIQ